MDSFGNVYPTLLGCFLIIMMGYVCGRTGLISTSQGKGIERYISRVALPALLFKSLVELDFSKVDWNFWLGILAAKAVLFVVVATLTLLVGQPVAGNLGKAGLFGIFVTQSNDLALGLPLFSAIYKDTHPEYVQYLYLLIPVSVALLNPVGFLMLEFYKNSKENDNRHSKLSIVWKAVKGVISNPLVFMVLLGIVFNLFLNATRRYTGFNREHWFLSPFLSVLGNSFGATSLFYLGFNLVGNTSSSTGLSMIVPFLLVCCKSLIFPVIARQTVFWLQRNSTGNASVTSLSSFAFIYGTLPTAPPVAVYSAMYEVHVNTISTSMVLGTFLSAPVMFVSSKMIMVMSSEGDEISRGFNKALFDIGILSIICCIWVKIVLISTKYYKRLLHQCTLSLIAFQLVLSFSIVLSMNKSLGDRPEAILALFLIGSFGTTIWTTLVCYALATVRCKGERSASQKRPIIFPIGICCPIIIGISLALTKAGSPPNFLALHRNSSGMDNILLEYVNANKVYNWSHGVVQVLSVLICVVFLIILQRYDKYCRCSEKSGTNLRQLPGDKDVCNLEDSENVCGQCQILCQKIEDIEDFSKGNSCNYKDDRSQMESETYLCEREESHNGRKRLLSKRKAYGTITPDTDEYKAIKDIEKVTFEDYLQGDSHQRSRHVILVLFLCLFSILNVFLCFERLKQDCQAHRSGVFLEIEFLAFTCTIGQGFLSFAVFGFNKIFFNLLSFERFGCLQPTCVARKIQLQPVQYLDQTVKDICSRFQAHHFENCSKDLVCNLRFHFKSYKNVFRGDKMVDWIIEFGLANTRADAVYYGNCLLQGRVLQHCLMEHYFYDLPYFYRFCNELQADVTQ